MRVKVVVAESRGKLEELAIRMRSHCMFRRHEPNDGWRRAIDVTRKNVYLLYHLENWGHFTDGWPAKHDVVKVGIIALKYSFQ